MVWAIFFRSTVFPAFGWATINALCPFPIGATRSIIRVEISMLESSSEIRSFGNIGVSDSKSGLFIATPGSSPFTVTT